MKNQYIVTLLRGSYDIVEIAADKVTKRPNPGAICTPCDSFQEAKKKLINHIGFALEQVHLMTEEDILDYESMG